MYKKTERELDINTLLNPDFGMEEMEQREQVNLVFQNSDEINFSSEE
ncbi:hypothetical protein RZN22_09405 [Bacillaceae bacterium S4-13-58]